MKKPRFAKGGLLAASFVVTTGCASNPPPQSYPPNPPAPTQPGPSTAGPGPQQPPPSNIQKRPDGTCVQYANVNCPPGVSCNPPPPKKVDCPPGM